MANVIHLNKSTFDATITSGITLVDFWAPWCGPCRALAPILDQIADKYDGKAVIAKVNVDENQELAIQFNIMAIPRMILFKDGKTIGQIEGLAAADRIAALIDAHL